MTSNISIRELHEQESLKDFTARIRKQEFGCGSLARVFALARGVRRAAKLGIDPEYTDALLAFDKQIDEACLNLSRIIHYLLNLRERVDKEKIEAKRADLSGLKFYRRRKALATYPIKRYGVKERKLTVDDVRLALEGLDPKQIANLLEMVNAER